MQIFNLEPTVRQVLHIMTPDEMCNFLYDYGYINSNKFPSITSGNDVKTFVESELFRWSKYLTWDKLTSQTVIAILTLNRQDDENTLLYSGNSSAVSSTSITIPGANGDFTDKTLMILNGAAEGRVRNIDNWNNTTKVATVSNWIANASKDALPTSISALTIKEPINNPVYDEILNSVLIYSTPLETNQALERHFVSSPEDFLTEEIQNRFYDSVNVNSSGVDRDFYISFGDEFIYENNLTDIDTPDFTKHVVPLKQVRLNTELGQSISVKEPADLAASDTSSKSLPDYVWNTLSEIPAGKRVIYGGFYFPDPVIDYRKITFNAVTSGNALNSGSFKLVIDIGSGNLTTADIDYNVNHITLKSAIEAVLPADHYAQVAFDYSGSNWSSFKLKIFNDDPTNWRFERNVPIISCSITDNTLSTPGGSSTITIFPTGSESSYSILGAVLLDQRYDNPTVVYTNNARSLTSISGTAQSQSVVHSGTARDGSNTITPSQPLHSIRLSTGASGSNDFYNGMKIVITGGTGSGQYRTISDYDGSGKYAYVSGRWITKPDNTSTYEIYSAKTIKLSASDTALDDEYVNYRITIGSGLGNGYYRNIDSYNATTKIATLDIPWRDIPNNTSNYILQKADCIKLNTDASASNDFYNGMTITIVSGTGEGQVRYISDYDGTTKIATVNVRWFTIPDNTSEIVIKQGIGNLIESDGSGGGDSGIPFELPFNDHKKEWMTCFMDTYVWRIQQYALANQMPEDELAVDNVSATAETSTAYYPNSTQELELVPSEYFLQLRDDLRWKNDVNNIRSRFGRYIEEQVASGIVSSQFSGTNVGLQAWVGVSHCIEADYRGAVLGDSPRRVLGESFIGGCNFDEFIFTEGYPIGVSTSKKGSKFGIGPSAGGLSAVNSYSSLRTHSTLIDGNNFAFKELGVQPYPIVEQKIKSISRVSGTVTVELFSEDNFIGTVIHEGYAVSGSNNSITLDSAASTIDDVFTKFANWSGSSTQDRTIYITKGTGIGQTRSITDYNGTTKVATVDKNWTTQPDTTSFFKIVVGGATLWEGNIQSASNGVSQATITLDNTASAVDNAYNVLHILILKDGNGKHQAVRIANNTYVGATRTLNLEQRLSVIPSNGDSVIIAAATLNELGGSISRVTGHDIMSDLVAGYIPGKVYVSPYNTGNYTGMNDFIHPFRSPFSGNVVNSTNNTLELAYDTDISLINDDYIGCRVHIFGGNTNTPVNWGEDKLITDYTIIGGGAPNTRTYTITVDSNWDDNPDSTCRFIIYHPKGGFLVNQIGINSNGNPYLVYDEDLVVARSDASVTAPSTNIQTTSGCSLYPTGINDFEVLLTSVYQNRACISASKIPLQYIQGILSYNRSITANDINGSSSYHYEDFIHYCLNGSLPGGLYFKLGDLSGCDPLQLKKVYQTFAEVQSLVGNTGYKPLPLSADFIKLNGTQRYVISGMAGDRRRVYRVSLQNDYNIKEDIATTESGLISYSPATFRLADGDTLIIPNSQIYTYDNSVADRGFWVIQEIDSGGINFAGNCSNRINIKMTSSGSIRFLGIHDGPILTEVDDIYVHIGDTISFFIDAEGINLIFTLVDGPNTATIDESSGEFTWVANAIGNFYVIIRVIDENDLYDEISFYIIVSPSSIRLVGQSNIPISWIKKCKSKQIDGAFVPAITSCKIRFIKED